VTMLQRWPVRQPRPIRSVLRIADPLITGQRIIDTFFPLGKGGAAAITGRFRNGQTITQHQLAKWSDAEIIVFIRLRERGNEMTEVLREFPELEDRGRGGRSWSDDSLSPTPRTCPSPPGRSPSTPDHPCRVLPGTWACPWRSSRIRRAAGPRRSGNLQARLEEMPAEEGFPASLPTRLAQFYERGGAVTTLAGDRASVSIVGAVSPPGGDFTEPVTQHTRRFIRCFWALERSIANARHYPSIHWLHSYSDTPRRQRLVGGELSPTGGPPDRGIDAPSSARSASSRS
jgi:V/A-type H+-transporting ATPase subunit A